jgi:hypothetical protein
MWNGRKYTAAAIVAVALAAATDVAAAASVHRGNNGYAGVYNSDGAPPFGGDPEDGGAAYGAATTPAPGRAHPGQRRREPRRLE